MTVHPIILEKLQRFSRQRRRLILWRGVSGAVALWFATMMAVALLDRFILLPDGLRLGLSLAGYVATGVLFWLECGRQLAHPPDVRELARLVELVAPQLREELLAAVELAEGESQWDSEEFRAALQQATARNLGAVQIEALLNRNLIAGWVSAAVAAVALVVVLLVMPGFIQSFARAVAPTANLDRYSRVHINIIAPTSEVVPEGDSVPVIVGTDAPDAVLETFPSGERIPMLLSAANQFTAAIQMNQALVQFRIRAQDALTRKYTLTPRPRPHVVKFQKTYHYPPYSQLPAETVTEENGDLDALDGTEVELSLAVDQPVKEATLQIATSSGKQEIPLSRSPVGQLIARVPLTSAGIYQIRLVAAQTDFENKYSPQYEIRIRPDLIPFAKIDQPEKGELVLPPDAVVNLAGSATDDFGLARVEQQIQVNRGSWKTVTLSQTNSVETKLARSWDLFDLGVQPGDHVLTKLVALDLKGQRGESTPLRIRIAAAGFDPDRLNALKDRQALHQSIHAFRESAEQLDAKTRDARADPLQQKQAQLAAAVADRKAEEVLREIKDLLPRTKDDRDSADLVLVGAAISRAQHAGVSNSTALVRAADDTHRQLLAAAEATAASRDLEQLVAEQRAAPTDFTKPDRAAHRQALAAAETKAIEEQLKPLAEVTGTIARNLARDRENLEKASPTTLQASAEQLQRTIDTAATALRNLEHDLDQRAASARKNLQEQTGTAADAVAKITAQPESRQSAVEQLKDRAALEERRPYADAPFVADLGKAADALTDVASFKPIEAALRKLEAGHALDEQVAALQRRAAQERWEKPVTPRDWEKTQQQLQALPEQLARAQLPADLKPVLQSPAAQAIKNEMAQRPTGPANSAAAPMEKLAGDLDQVQQQLQPALAQARAEIDKRVTALSERLAGLAHTAETLAAETRQAEAKQIPSLAAAQQQLDKGIDDVKDAIRREANTQSLGTEEGRARARDADDAAAMLRQPTPSAADLLAAQPEPDLQAAAAQQTKLAADLKLLAEHYQNDGASQRAALRDAEKELGLKPALDAEYAKAQALEKLAGLSPPEQLAELEKALPDNQPMRHELSAIAKDALQSAAANLQKSAGQERSIAQQAGQMGAALPPPTAEQAKQIAAEAQRLAEQTAAIAPPASQKLAAVAQNIPQDFTKSPAQLAPQMQTQAAVLQQAAAELNTAAAELGQQAGQLAQQAGQLATALNQAKIQQQALAPQPGIAQAVRTAGQDAARAGRHEARLGQTEAGQQLQQLGQQIENQTGPQVAQAAAAMAKSPAQVQAAAQAAQAAILSPLAGITTALQQSPPAPGQAAPSQQTPSQLATVPEAAAKWLARALDSLDRALQPGSPAAAQAAQAQADSMMATRSQGLTPGEIPTGGGGQFGRADGSDPAPLPEFNLSGGQWGKLPPKLARDLIDSQREGVSGQYREMVEMYFRAVADKAREKQP